MPVATGRYAPPGISEVHWVTTIAVPGVPTAIELNAGVDITPDFADIPDIPRTGNTVDVADLSSKFDKLQVGTRGGDVVTVAVFRNPASEVAYDTLLEDVVGFLIVARGGLATAGTFAIADVIDIYPATVLSQADPAPGRNAATMADVELVITDDPTRNFAVAA